MSRYAPPLRLMAVFALMLVLLELALGAFVWLRGQLPANTPGALGFVLEAGFWFAAVLLFTTPLLVVERLAPGSGLPPHYGRALTYWAAYVPVALLSSHAVSALVLWLDVPPLLRLNLDQITQLGVPRMLAHVGLLVLSMLLFDFFFYWFHRMQHAVPLLWRFHRVHHSIRAVNALACYHHPLEDLLRIPFLLVPLALAFRIDVPQMLLLSAFFSAWAYINHLDSSLNFGPLRVVLVDNHYHRLHHSLRPEHFGTNFASYFSLWDALFRTRLLPQGDPFGFGVGLSDVPEATNLRELWAIPFRAPVPPH